MKEEDFKEKKGDSECGGKMVIVVVKASSRGVPRSALVWALNHIVQPGDCIKLLVLIPSHPSSSTWIKGFTVFTRDCTPTHPSTLSGTLADQKDDIEHTSSQMVLQLHDLYDPQKVKVRIKVVPRSQQGVVASEVKKAQSNWVIFDKDLKHERKHCMAELQCNVVVMKRSQAKVLRLNLVNNNNDNQLKKMGTQVGSLLSTSESEKAFPKCLRTYFEESTIIAKGPVVTPASSPDQESPLTVTDLGASSISSSDMGTSSLVSGSFPGRKEDFGTQNSPESDSDRVSDKKPCPSTKTSYFLKWMADSISSSRVDLSKNLYRPSKLGLEPQNVDLGLSRKVRETISLSQKAPLGPPPLCSICQHKAPVFGNPPRWFTYSELELATGGFSGANFLAEGGFGSVHRGVLLNGQVVAVKQYKLASSQGDREFCSEVEVLSCAQHRNVVMLIGFCVEAGKRLLVYEYICNGSLHSHLYGKNNGDALEWTARQKIAVGATRGLRYLHEECRVGCIVHRDMRPNNILLTHDFEPLVGDFGLARWQPDGDMGVETRILGTFGYLAPEYAQSGQITEKADVYSFGVVLLELVTGRKAIDINRPKGQQCLTEWARTLLRKGSIAELVDPRLGNCYSVEEVHRMLRCASLCIKQDPYSRPRMSQVLRILEGDIAM